MSRIGYARVSTIDQDLEIQVAKLKAEGCGVIRSEKVSGASRNVLDGTVIGKNMQQHRHHEFIRSLNAIDDPGCPARPFPQHLRRLKHKGGCLAHRRRSLELISARQTYFCGALRSLISAHRRCDQSAKR